MAAGILALNALGAAAQTPPQPLGALLADPLVPAGRVSIDFAPSYARWKSRFGRYERDGRLVDAKEPLGADLTDPTTATLFPGLADLQESLRSLSGISQYTNVLGATTGDVTQELTRIDTGLRVGVFDWLTIGVDVPYVRSRAVVQAAFLPDPDANLGVNPNTTDPAAVSALLVGLDDAAAAADQRAGSLCAQGTGAACDAARSLADRTIGFRDLARTAYLASPFFPVDTSPVAEGLSAALESLNGALESAGLPRVAASMAFASGVLSSDDLAGLPKDPSIQGSPLASLDDHLWTLGDVELSGTVRLLEGEVRDSGAASPRYAWTVLGGGLVRLATGTLDDPAVAYDLPSGDGQMDVEGRVDAALRVGTHLDLRASARYGVQRSRAILRRVAPHEELFPPAFTTRAVRWTPGSYRSVTLSPRVHLAEALSLALDVVSYHRGDDRYELLGEEPFGAPPVNVADLEHETGMTLWQVGIGLRYSTLALARSGLSDTPLELGVRLLRATSGSGGNVPVATRAEFSVSLTRRLWGSR